MLLTNVFGLENQNWLANEHIPIFWIIYVLMGVWQGVGWDPSCMWRRSPRSRGPA